MVSKKTMNTLLAGAVAVTALGTGMNTAHAASKEKCYGVVKAGMNDCANAAKTHSCAGHAKADGAGGEWLSLPKGTCDKLVGGSLTPIESASVTTTTVTETVETVKTKAMDAAQEKATEKANEAATNKINGLLGK